MTDSFEATRPKEEAPSIALVSAPTINLLDGTNEMDVTDLIRKNLQLF